ncbi:pilus assembly PilX family protein [Methylocaldum sp.]|uniref:pilus assembly PilX family protein n=1 Tax=Methylocaldum sp. TaxID=1969727 RepID=UPI002D300668|nr:PilX N-terminal domain-containing pilus assembly protein [Methylocaldum sp.]HYE34438.1 PilX N-terminal domain-containing pilus assembly protein [Methylocaldum sp.]
MRKRPRDLPHVPGRQRGIALVMALTFLTILILTGTSAALNTSLQEHMAGNTRNRNLAFQAAEAALKDAEITLTTWRTSAFDGSVPGLRTYVATQANDSVYWGTTYDWTAAANYRTPTQTVAGVAEQPKYVVEKMPNNGATEYYRVTARGVGGEINAVVVLQALYTYTP